MSASFQPLAGVKIVDLSHVIAGPLATFQLAQMGADVLKIESPDGGDVMRRGAKGAKSFVTLNAGKRKATIDFGTAEGRDRIIALVRDADVFVDNLRPGVLEAKGLGYRALLAVNPRLVYCSISGYGRAPEGNAAARALSQRPAYDHVVQVATGMTLATGEAGAPPTKIGFPLIDAATAMVATTAILAGLRERDRTGKGLLLDVSMAGAALQLMYPVTCEALTDGTEPARTGNQAFSGSPGADVFQAADGWIGMAANTPAQFGRLLEVLDLAHIARDPALFEPSSDPKAQGFVRTLDVAAVKAHLRAAIARFAAADLETKLSASGVPAARARTVPEFTREAEAVGLLAPLDLVDEGVAVRTPGLGFKVG